MLMERQENSQEGIGRVFMLLQPQESDMARIQVGAEQLQQRTQPKLNYLVAMSIFPNYRTLSYTDVIKMRKVLCK